MQQNAQLLLLQTIEGLIQEGELDKALEALLALDEKSQAGLRQEVVTVSGNYRQASKEYRINQTIGFEEFSRYAARTRVALLEMMKEVPRRVQLNAQLNGLDTYQFKVPDNVRLEKIIGNQSNLLRINWLEKALMASKAVCRVVNGDNLGTGFITKDGYLYTNNHVLPDATAAGNARVEFNYQMNSNGQIQQRSVYQLDASTYITSPPTQLDFVRIKVIDNPADPISRWGFVEIDPSALPVKGEPATIIQHPKGEDMQIALNANDVLSNWNQYLFYTTDTEPGSSGSPVFNKDWKVIAIHHAGKTEAEGGMQINAAGERAAANRGILFSHIFKFINDSTGNAPVAAGANSGHESFTPPVNEPIAAAPSTPVVTQPVATTPAPTVAAPKNAIPIFLVLYDLQDDARVVQLNKHLTVLKMTKKIVVHNVHQVKAGEDVMAEAEKNLAIADYILTIISPNLFNEDAAWLGMTLMALESGKKVIPVRIEKADVEGTGLEKLRSLPSMNRTVSDFPNPEAAYSDIVDEIKRLISGK